MAQVTQRCRTSGQLAKLLSRLHDRVVRWLLFIVFAMGACSSEGDATANQGSGGTSEVQSGGQVSSTGGETAGVMTGGDASSAGTQSSQSDAALCMAGQSQCDMTCVDTLSESAHCGDCNTACAAMMECVMGACVPACDTRVDCEFGLACLQGSCEDLTAGRSFQQDESRDSTYGTSPEIDLSATGHAALVWSASQGDELRVSRYILAQDQWTAPLPIHDPMAPFPGSPDIAVDDAGNAMAVWHQGGNAYRDGWANRYDVSLNMWMGPQRIEPDGNGFAETLRVVMDHAGNATVVWPYAQDTGGGMVQATRYDAANGTWGDVLNLSQQVSTGAGDVTAAIDERGNVMAAWVQQPPGKSFNDAQTALYDVTTGSWSTAVSIDAQDLGHANHPSVSADDEGNFFVAWHQSGEDVLHVWVNRYDSQSRTWGTAQKLDSATGSQGARWPKLGADEHGNCLATWEQDSIITSALYEAANEKWTMIGPVDSNTGAVDSRLAVDRGGNGIAFWRGQSSRVYASHFDAQTRTWSAREAVDPVYAERTGNPNIDMDAEGRAIATWHAIGDSGSWEVMTNRFE